MTATIRNRLAIALLASGVAIAIVPLSQALAEPAPPMPPEPPRIEHRIAEAEADIPRPPEPPVPPEPGVAGKRVEKRIFVRDGAKHIDIAHMEGCAGEAISEVESLGQSDGKHSRVHIRICGDDGESATDALAAVRRARDDVAADTGIPEGVKADILGKLDGEIARLEGASG